VDDPAFASVVGLVLQAEKEALSGRGGRHQVFEHLGKAGEWWQNAKQWAGRFLP
jgi:hypothetical protein